MSGPAAALLDVNVLVALAWPNHVGHTAAQVWFAAESGRGWATTPFTQAGFVRVSSNRRALPTATTPALAIEMLSQLSALPGHVFWPDTVAGVVNEGILPSESIGHRQVTDAHLVSLCLVHGGPLVTFDRAIRDLTEPGRDLVHLLTAED